MTDSILQVQEFIGENGCNPKQWYVGITFKPQETLFNHHNVHRQLNSWIYRLIDSPEGARRVHDSLVELGCDSIRNPNECEGTIVYVYLKSHTTRP